MKIKSFFAKPFASYIYKGIRKGMATAVADQHYAAQTANYKLMMIALAGVYGIYLFLRIRRKREMDRILGNNA